MELVHQLIEVRPSWASISDQQQVSNDPLLLILKFSITLQCLSILMFSSVFLKVFFFNS